MEFFGVLFGGVLFTLVITAWTCLSRHYKLGKRTVNTGIALLLVPVVLLSLWLGWYGFVIEPRTIALIKAAEIGDAPEVQTLLRDGADPNASFEGETPLNAAQRGKQDDVVKLLKKAGAVE